MLIKIGVCLLLLSVLILSAQAVGRFMDDMRVMDNVMTVEG